MATLLAMLGTEVLLTAQSDDDWEQDAWEKDHAPEWAADDDDDDEEEDDDGYHEDEADAD